MLVAARTADRDIISVLLQDYLEELSAFAALPRDEHGFTYPYLDFYWRAPDRHPFLIMNGQQVAGFVLVRLERDPVTGEQLAEIAEFYVAPAFRRQRIGSTAAEQALRLFPGRWRIAVMRDNGDAQRFWRKLIGGFDAAFSEQAPAVASNHMWEFDFSVV